MLGSAAAALLLASASPETYAELPAVIRRPAEPSSPSGPAGARADGAPDAAGRDAGSPAPGAAERTDVTAPPAPQEAEPSNVATAAAVPAPAVPAPAVPAPLVPAPAVPAPAAPAPTEPPVEAERLVAPVPPAPAAGDGGDCAPLFTARFDRESARPVAADLDAHLQQLAAWLRAHPAARVFVEGHADPLGDEEYNVILSYRRAGAVAKLLTAAGIAPDRLSIRAYGEGLPPDHGSGADSRRRVSLRIDGGQECPPHPSHAEPPS